MPTVQPSDSPGSRQWYRADRTAPANVPRETLRWPPAWDGRETAGVNCSWGAQHRMATRHRHRPCCWRRAELVSRETRINSPGCMSPGEGDSDSRETERGMISRRSEAVAVTDIVAQYVQGTKRSTPAPSLAQGWCGDHVSRETSMNGPVLRSPPPVPSQPNASRGSAEHSACSGPSSTDATWSRRVRTSCTRGAVQGMRTS